MNNNAELMKEKSDLVKQLNYAYQNPKLTAEQRSEVNLKLKEAIEVLVKS